MIICLCLNPAIDRYAEIVSFYYDEPVRLENIHEEAGGKAVNAARVLSRFQVPHLLIYPLGGKHSEFFRKDLSRDKVHTLTVPISDMRFNQSILDRKVNRIIKFNTPGSAISATLWEEIRSLVLERSGPHNVLLFSGSLAPGVTENELVRLLSEWKDRSGGIVAVDSSPSVLRRVLDMGSADFILPNLPEAEELAGRDLDEESKIKKFLVECDTRSLRTIITAGEKGAYYLDDGLTQVPAPQVEVISTVGAGDAFAAGFILSLEAGLSIGGAVREAVKFGAAACTRAGTGTVSPQEIKEFL